MPVLLDQEPGYAWREEEPDIRPRRLRYPCREEIGCRSEKKGIMPILSEPESAVHCYGVGLRVQPVHLRVVEEIEGIDPLFDEIPVFKEHALHLLLILPEDDNAVLPFYAGDNLVLHTRKGARQSHKHFHTPMFPSSFPRDHGPDYPWVYPVARVRQADDRISPHSIALNILRIYH
jgi:hypothetical protein